MKKICVCLSVNCVSMRTLCVNACVYVHPVCMCAYAHPVCEDVCIRTPTHTDSASAVATSDRFFMAVGNEGQGATLSREEVTTFR